MFHRRNGYSISRIFPKNKNNENANHLKKLFQKSYLTKKKLKEATRYLVNEIFGNYGLVIIDGDHKILKQEFIPFIKKEILYQYTSKTISKTNDFINKNYKLQVKPRNINLFYKKENLRERIVLENKIYKVKNTNISFSETEIVEEIENNPQHFSPNVIMRTLYQEVIIPNICYIGGAGEIAYWLQLKKNFEESKIPFPILLLRNSALLISKKQSEKLKKMQISFKELFLEEEKLISKKIIQFSKLPLNFTKQKTILKELFEQLKPLVDQTDISFKGALQAQEKKQLKGLLNLEKRLLKAEKRKNADISNRIRKIKNDLFPEKELQERNTNFAEFYIEHGEKLITNLMANLNPLEFKYTIIEL